ncbi:MAG: hypothetical protein ACE5D6_06830 [Candidatus Zixiibacteriota bacterium]
MKTKKLPFKRWHCLILGLLTMIDGLVMALSLGKILTMFSLKYSLNMEYRAIDKRIENGNSRI